MVHAITSFPTLAAEMLELAARALYRPPLGDGHSLKYLMSSVGAPGGTEPARFAGTDASLIGEELGVVPVVGLHEDAIARTARAAPLSLIPPT
jgi:hypothetical protein